jgi:uncharacterized membrane protein YfcA
MRINRPARVFLKALLPIAMVLLIVLMVSALLKAIPAPWLPWMVIPIALLFVANYFLTRWWVKSAGRKCGDDGSSP